MDKPELNTMIVNETGDACKIFMPPEGLAFEVQDMVGQKLRAVYEEILCEPVPDRFLRLLAQLESGQVDIS